MRIISYNLNGIRSSVNKGLPDWLRAASPDVFCVQELKAQEGDFDHTPFRNLGYDVHLFPAQKKGYSGVGIFSRIAPDHVEMGCGIKDYDFEGRVIRADFGDVSVLSIYFPSGTTGDERQQFKYRFLDDMLIYFEKLKKKRKQLVLCGDFNICNKTIDIHNPVANANSSGFLPEERAWMEKLLSKGYIDSFRQFNPDPHNYTWWSFRAVARKRNLGWRIDYQIITENLGSRLSRAAILPEAQHSDHCPVLLELK